MPVNISGVNTKAITYGFDHNTFQKVIISNATFNTQCDVYIPYTTQGVYFVLETANTTVQISFNGVGIHDELTTVSSNNGIASVKYDFRVVSKIWFQIISGASATISVRAWGQ